MNFRGLGIASTGTSMRVGRRGGRPLTFRIEARDKEAIGDGLHERVVVNVARFDERVRRKIATGD